MENLDLAAAFNDANVRQDWEAQVKFDCNYTDEGIDAAVQYKLEGRLADGSKRTDEETEALRDEIRQMMLAGIYKKGDIVTIRPKALVHMPHDKGGRPWGKRDVVDFAIVTFKNLTKVEAMALVEPVTFYYDEDIVDPETPGEKETHTQEVLVARRRHVLDLDEALQEKSPVTLVDKEKKRRFYARESYDDVEQPLQKNDCCLKHVLDISESTPIKERLEKSKARVQKEKPKSRLITLAENNAKTGQTLGTSVAGIKGRINGEAIEKI